MEMTEIRREKVGVVAIGKLDVSLSGMAAQILGYNARGAELDAPVLPKLRAALSRLDIEILNPLDVARYQMEKRHAAERQQLHASHGREPQLFWQECEISRYRKPIPDFVLNKAIQIKKEVPECQILIVGLDENPDPFLVVKIRYEEEYYVEVWGEPKFESR